MVNSSKHETMDAWLVSTARDWLAVAAAVSFFMVGEFYVIRRTQRQLRHLRQRRQAGVALTAGDDKNRRWVELLIAAVLNRLCRTRYWDRGILCIRGKGSPLVAVDRVFGDRHRASSHHGDPTSKEAVATRRPRLGSARPHYKCRYVRSGPRTTRSQITVPQPS